MSNLKLRFLSAILLLEIPNIFGRIFLLYSQKKYNFKDKSGKERIKKQGKRENVSRIYYKVLPAKKSCSGRRWTETIDKTLVKKRHVEDRQPKEETSEENKRKKKSRNKVQEKEERVLSHGNATITYNNTYISLIYT